MAETRIERDSMGEMVVPANAYYGAQTARAVENFPISGLRFPRSFIAALGTIKGACARVNAALGLLDQRLADAIARAAAEVAEGRLDGEFVLDVFQTGSGTSTNMNANEVIANRALELLGAKRGDKSVVHPNDHVNMGQSTNDVFPTAIHVAAYGEITRALLPAPEGRAVAFEERARAFADVVKAGRTHLQDAVPMTLGQEFGGYASVVRHGIARVKATLRHLAELPIGGTALGTGLNAPPGFGEKVAAELASATGLPFVTAPDRFEAMQNRDAAVETSGALRTLAVGLMKIANDLRLLTSGGRTGLNEIELPATQPGSSIMPGKVNPVIPEAVNQVAALVIGHDATIAIAGLNGNLDLNVMMPVIAHALLEEIAVMAAAARDDARGRGSREDPPGGRLERHHRPADQARLRPHRGGEHGRARPCRVEEGRGRHAPEGGRAAREQPGWRCHRERRRVRRDRALQEGAEGAGGGGARRPRRLGWLLRRLRRGPDRRAPDHGDGLDRRHPDRSQSGGAARQGRGAEPDLQGGRAQGPPLALPRRDAGGATHRPVDPRRAPHALRERRAREPRRPRPAPPRRADRRPHLRRPASAPGGPDRPDRRPARGHRRGQGRGARRRGARRRLPAAGRDAGEHLLGSARGAGAGERAARRPGRARGERAALHVPVGAGAGGVGRARSRQRPAALSPPSIVPGLAATKAARSAWARAARGSWFSV